MGDAFGADVININGSGADTDDWGAAPHAESTTAKRMNRIMRDWNGFI